VFKNCSSACFFQKSFKKQGYYPTLMARRVRTHANPFSCFEPTLREAWTHVIGDTRPLCVDMGSGQGDFIIDSALAHPENNYVGIEVRRPMFEKVCEKIISLKLPHVVCVQGNASISLRTMFLQGEVHELYVHFPDPWFKPRHKKRRVITPDVVADLSYVLSTTGKIYVLTDVEEVFVDFCSLLGTAFKQVPYEAKSEKSYWEKWHEEKGTKLYGACFVLK
jgi:tRNA (guanine-N7-)-methyltransferase